MLGAMMELSPGYRDSSTNAVTRGDIVGAVYTIRDEVVRHKPEAAEAKPAYRDFRAGDVRHSLADITRARTLLGYEPEYDVRQGLRLAGDWYDAHL